MRVISGQAKGHPLKAVPGSNTRPTTDKVKESLFSIIGPYFEEDRVLDLFAGTGGLGIEALSRGAASAVFIDSSSQSIEIVKRNLESTKLIARAEVYRNDAHRALKLLERKGEAFDLLFLDPPYAMKDCNELLLDAASRGLVADRAIAVIEHHPEVEYSEKIGAFERTRYVVYGDIALSIYRYSAIEESVEFEAVMEAKEDIQDESKSTDTHA
ncbi:MAG: 16S rRNA (guanine(966)-N(2))-methyltransferase RsmD [Candidatus Cohnella colombiensis]|uniref:16S rRNA (Guanine(966)-N(2))-methyltransferase RsmD n=1 Tax=Candidatus Cohnella colombiensis TaxID=3121368 RepID=A0AA95F745_9BACL|nr:MAG: 16S rRNA (guanine(966)-N(2))-methyltransferase RsmD [Cohnella sp.]